MPRFIRNENALQDCVSTSSVGFEIEDGLHDVDDVDGFRDGADALI
ncbi:hypothetical protein [uncultured Adlercreutzia sp.]|nr:hypothetical protein [uncultured Adlercreutzia sp.]